MTERDEPMRTGDLAGDREAGPARLRLDPASGGSIGTTEEARPPEASQPGEAGHSAAGNGEGSAPRDGHGSVDSAADPSRPAPGGAPDRIALLAEAEAADYRTRWEAVQIGFVDEPRAAVEQADGLVAEVMQQLARRFTEERGRLEAQWTSGGEVGTEELRVALQRYRTFFHRLLEQ